MKYPCHTHSNQCNSVKSDVYAVWIFHIILIHQLTNVKSSAMDVKHDIHECSINKMIKLR